MWDSLYNHNANHDRGSPSSIHRDSTLAHSPYEDIWQIFYKPLFRPYWYVATGFRKWGMTFSMLSAFIICDRICGRENPYGKLFSPWRFHILAGAKDFLKDVGESIAGLVKGAFHLPYKELEKLQKGHGGIVRIGLKRFACYKDEQGKVYKISAGDIPVRSEKGISAYKRKSVMGYAVLCRPMGRFLKARKIFPRNCKRTEDL